MSDALDAVKKRSGLIGWGLVTAGIGIYDYYAIKSQRIETLSTAVHNLQGVYIIGAAAMWGVVTAHLFVEPQIKKLAQRGR